MIDQITRTVADIPDDELLRRAVRNARSRHRDRRPTDLFLTISTKWPRWAHVCDVFDLDRESAEKLCRRFGIDPNEEIFR